MTLTLEGVSRKLGDKTHIYPTNLTLEKSSMNVLLGPTLAGKTSLMRLMAGLDKPSSGRILWNGQDVTQTRVQDRNIAIVYQQFINYPNLTVYENIASPLRLMGLKAADIDKRVKNVAELLRLGGLLQRRPLELSGGQQQRCALARALVKQAGLVLLDEPLANLDYKLREELRAEIPRIFAASGAIFVYATTEPEEALLLGGNTATLWEGQITQFGRTSTVYRAPKDLISARVFSDPPLNVIKVKAAQNILSFGPETETVTAAVTAVPNGEFLAGFRAHHLNLSRKTEQEIEFACGVEGIEVTGSESFVLVTHEGQNWVAQLPGVHHFERGQRLSLFLDAAKIFLFHPNGQRVDDGKGGEA